MSNNMSKKKRAFITRDSSRRLSRCAMVLVALGFAGNAWSQAKRHAFANDPLPLASLDSMPIEWRKEFPVNSVTPVLFVPTDWSIDSEVVRQDAAALRTALAEVQRFYGSHTISRNPFHLNPLEVVQARGRRAHYGISWNGLDIYLPGNITLSGDSSRRMLQELWNRGFLVRGGYGNGHITLIFVKGAGGWSASGLFGAPYLDGVAALGDWTIDGIVGRVPEWAYWWGGRRQQTGMVAHMLGHGFGLRYPDVHGAPPSSSVMGDWWNFPDIGLSVFDRLYLSNERRWFFDRPPPKDVKLMPIRGGARVYWIDRSRDETGFIVQDRPDGDEPTYRIKVKANVTFLDLKGRPNEIKCAFVSAEYSDGYLAQSYGGCLQLEPAVPTGLRAENVGGFIKLKWDPSPGVRGYHILMRTPRANWVIERLGAFTEVIVSRRSEGDLSCFAVVAVNRSSQSAPSPWACVHNPRTP
jgi:hypothetical protein